jgi:hypothetical protein
MDKYYIITFKSTHLAMRTERVLDSLNIEMIPTPRQISTSCGIAIKGVHNEFDEAKKLLGDDYNINSQAYLVEIDDGIMNFKKV